MFSTLTSWGVLTGARVLDLYAGSGALGLEAVSRGAAHATLVERHGPAAAVAGRNATLVLRAVAEARETNETLPDVHTITQSVQSFLESHQNRPGEAGASMHWDVVFIDPPYDIDEAELAANLSLLHRLLSGGAVVAVERSVRSLQPTWPDELLPLREKRYGETVIWWAETAEEVL